MTSKGNRDTGEIDLQEAKNRLMAARSALRWDINDLERKLEAARQERAHLYDSIVPISDVKQFILDYIDAKRLEYMPVVREMIMGVVYPARPYMTADRKPITPTEMRAALTVNPHNCATLAEQSVNRNGYFELLRNNKQWHSDIPFYCFFGDAIKKAIEENFDSLGIEYRSPHAHEIGPPLADRDARAAELDAEIKNIELDIAALVQKLHSLEVA